MLKSLLQAPGVLLVPGVYDGLGALLAERAGFPAVFLSGASLSYARLGRPDAGLVTASELADACARIADRVGIPILVDGDSGFGNAVNLQRTIRPARTRRGERGADRGPGDAEADGGAAVAAAGAGRGDAGADQGGAGRSPVAGSC